MKIVVDMNLSPDWIPFFARHGFEAVHWENIGDPRAKDRQIMNWARAEGHVVFSHDLDFGTLLAMTRASGPSVLQVRTQDVLPTSIGEIVLSVLRQHRSELEAGAIISVDRALSRVRILPIEP